jgi:excisionase family DNA binding protein
MKRPSNEFFTKSTLAEYLGITLRSLDRLDVRREGPPRVKIGRRVLFRREAVEAWLQERER